MSSFVLVVVVCRMLFVCAYNSNDSEHGRIENGVERNGTLLFALGQGTIDLKQ